MRALPAIAAAALLAGCAAQRPAAPIIAQASSRDTVYLAARSADTLLVLDSVRLAGDTVYRSRTVYRSAERVCTAYVARRDTVPAPYPVEVVREADKPFLGLTAPKWAAVCALLGAACVLAARLK